MKGFKSEGKFFRIDDTPTGVEGKRYIATKIGR